MKTENVGKPTVKSESNTRVEEFMEQITSIIGACRMK
jgi:hypothetical protein